MNVTETIDGVIERAVTHHRTELSARLRLLEARHRDAAVKTRDPNAAQALAGFADDCAMLAYRLDEHGTVGVLTMIERLQAFIAAAVVLGIPSQTLAQLTADEMVRISSLVGVASPI